MKKNYIKAIKKIERDISQEQIPFVVFQPSRMRKIIERGYFEKLSKEELKHEIEVLYDIKVDSSIGLSGPTDIEGEIAGIVKNYCLSLLKN